MPMNETKPENLGGTNRAGQQIDPWKAFYVLLAGGFMTLLDISIVNVALPSITLNLGATSSQLQWIVASYSLAFGLMLVPAGRLGDVFGRRNLFAMGIGGFTAASLLCGVATSANVLILARFIQGGFAAVISPQVMGLIQQMFRGPDRGKAFGFNGASIGVSTALGPVLGGLLVSALPLAWGWRSIFLINVPIGLIVVPLAMRMLPAPSGERQKIRLDLVGVILMSLITLLAMLPLIIATEHASLEGAPWWMLGVAVACWVVFMAWEILRDRAGQVVILPRALMRTPSFVLGTAIGTCYFVGFSGFFVTLTLYLQDGLGFAPWQAGLMQLPFAVGGTIAAASSGKLLARKGRSLVIIGITLSLSCMVALDLTAHFAPQGQLWWLVPIFFFIGGLGNGSTISPNQALTLSDVPVESSSTAAALLQATQRIGTTLSIAALTLAFFVTLPLPLRGQAASEPGQVALFSAGFSNALHVTEVAMLLAIILGLVDRFRRRH
ncbi:hypothetical protein BSR28_01055 [Boudabousia liubingyangii]|uniref:MFS transporter n=1 Tax=Boudabousia liubingyangii TaxID=1921764 RepID=UPI00093CFC00|nr:MFS transporter [Boudabousia liubingyangii]OKL48324.1 hypothetical protein BSR28_01055 [Boudabousia liubingyangii]